MQYFYEGRTPCRVASNFNVKINGIDLSLEVNNNNNSNNNNNNNNNYYYYYYYY